MNKDPDDDIEKRNIENKYNLIIHQNFTKKKDLREGIFKLNSEKAPGVDKSPTKEIIKYHQNTSHI